MYAGRNHRRTYTIALKIIRSVFERSKKKISGTRVSGEILKLREEAIILYLARLLDLTMNDGTLPGDWKRATVFHIHKGVTDH